MLYIPTFYLRGNGARRRRQSITYPTGTKYKQASTYVTCGLGEKATFFGGGGHLCPNTIDISCCKKEPF